MLIKLSIIPLSNSHVILSIMLTNFIYCSQDYAWFNAHGITDN